MGAQLCGGRQGEAPDNSEQGTKHRKAKPKLQTGGRKTKGAMGPASGTAGLRAKRRVLNGRISLFHLGEGEKPRNEEPPPTAFKPTGERSSLDKWMTGEKG